MDIKHNFWGLLTLACVVLTLGSCSGDDLSEKGGNGGDATTVNLSIDNKNGDTQDVIYAIESDVTHARVLIFSQEGRITANTFFGKIPDNGLLITKAFVGMKDIYVILNEPNATQTEGGMIAGSSKLNSIIRIANLDKVLFTRDNFPFYATDFHPSVSQFTMVRHYTQSDWSELDGVIHVGGQGADQGRVMAKVSLNISYTEGGITNETFAGDVEVTDMDVFNVPKYCVLAPTAYDDQFDTSSLKFTTSVSTSEPKTTTYSVDFYLPEHIVKDQSKHTYIKIKGRNKTTDEVSTWKVDLGAAAVDGATQTTNYDIARNSHYNVNATIKGYGEVDLGLKVEIEPWNGVQTESNPGEYINCATNELTLTRNRDNSSTTASVTFSANNMAGAVVTSKNDRIDINKAEIVSGKLNFSLNLGVNVTAIDDYDNYDEISIIVDNYVHKIKVSYQPTIELVDWSPKGVQVPWSGGEGTVWCETTVGEWYIVLKDDKGNEYARSSATAAVNNGVKTRQNRTIRMPVNIDGAPINYVVEVHHAILLPENTFSAKHFFRNTQKAGYKLALVPDGTSSFTPVEYGGEGASLSSVGTDGKKHELFFKYGSLYGIEAWVVDGVRKSTSDTYDAGDIAWYPTVPTTMPASWTAIAGLSGAFATTANSVKTNQGDPCKLVGLTTLDIAKGKVDNGEWKMATKAGLTYLFREPLVASPFAFPVERGGVIKPFGYRNTSGKIVQQSYTYGGPYAHALISGYDASMGHLAAWFPMAVQTWPHSYRANGGVNSTGYSGVVGNPNAQNGMSVRCIKVR